MKTHFASRSASLIARAVLGLVLCSTGIALALAGLSKPVTGTIPSENPTITCGDWTPTGSLTVARAAHTATLLQNGTVLVAGGPSDMSTELYDPANQTWTKTGSLSVERLGHTATLLLDGKVLVAGGAINGSTSTELYDPATGIWTLTGSLAAARVQHSATLLPNGNVLVAGGYDPSDTSNVLASTELYDPATGTWKPSGRLAHTRASHTATLLPNGQVLIAGGYGYTNNFRLVYRRNLELYDPATGTWTETGSLAKTRADHSATLLPDGRVLIVGGLAYVHRKAKLRNSVELYDPVTGTVIQAGSLATARYGHTATLLANGMVLIAGGNGVRGARTRAELYDPTSGTWSITDRLGIGRFDHTATLLPNETVLVAAGFGNFNVTLMTAELYRCRP